MSANGISRRATMLGLLVAACASGLAPAWADKVASQSIAFRISMKGQEFGVRISRYSNTHNLLTLHAIKGKYRHAILVPVSPPGARHAVLKGGNISIDIAAAGDWVLVKSTGEVVNVGRPEQARTADGESDSSSGGSAEAAPAGSGSTGGGNDGGSTGSGSSSTNGGSGDNGGKDDNSGGGFFSGLFKSIGVAVGAVASYLSGNDFRYEDESTGDTVNVRSDGSVLVMGGSSGSGNFMDPPPGVPVRPDVWY